MPVKACKENGQSGFKWGDSGKCYVYPAGDEKASGKAKQKAFLQGFAATGGTMKEGQKEIEHIYMGKLTINNLTKETANEI